MGLTMSHLQLQSRHNRQTVTGLSTSPFKVGAAQVGCSLKVFTSIFFFCPASYIPAHLALLGFNCPNRSSIKITVTILKLFLVHFTPSYSIISPFTEHPLFKYMPSIYAVFEVPAVVSPGL
jgi:hypothetical protein